MELVGDEMERDPELKRVTNLVIGAAIAVHRELGPGHAETAYQNALAIELDVRGINFNVKLLKDRIRRISN
jgi:GxxExxY protein